MPSYYPISIQNTLEKLNHPTWYALNEIHENISYSVGNYKFYQTDYCPFGAINPSFPNAALERTDIFQNDFFIVGTQPSILPENLFLKTELQCDQMILTNKIDIEFTDDIVFLNEQFSEELSALVNLVQPGFFKEKTIEMGEYFGIFNNRKLVAVTGERMKIKDATEISAVVTHPDYSGRGYAKQLVAFVANKIQMEHKLPFLHVAETNIPAIRLYEKLGFEHRIKMNFSLYSWQ